MRTDYEIRKINRGFQVTLPQNYREQQGLNIGDFIEINQENGKLILSPAKISGKSQRLKDLLASAPKIEEFDSMSEEEIMNMIRKEIKSYRKSKSSE